MCEMPRNSVGRDYCFKWGNHQGQFSDIVRELLTEESMVDVTLAVGSERIHAHRIVLSACSSLFQELLSQVREEHPVIIFSDMSPQIIRLIVEYTYQGEIRVPTECISSLIQTAQILKIVGLMDVESLDDGEPIQTKDSSHQDEHLIKIDDIKENILDDSDHNNYEEVSDNSLQDSVMNDSERLNKKRRKKRESVKREYNEDMVESAIKMLKSGKTLIEAATKNNIPRSTLYMRARAIGLQMHATRSAYPMECMKAAIDMVLKGASLQQASEMFSIPKTVLWRRIQKEGFRIMRTHSGRRYDTDKRRAAVHALSKGENLTKVSLKYQIPKTTLFRDKVRLIDEGKLPVTFLKRRKTEDDKTKKSRLEKAVAACRSGKMSQAMASATFQVPKTTIWRRLKQNNKPNDSSRTRFRNVKDHEAKRDNNDMDFEYCEVAASNDIPITYIDENTIPGDSVIILTTDDVGGLNLDNRQIIVDQDTDQDYINCEMNLEDNSNFSSANNVDKISIGKGR